MISRLFGHLHILVQGLVEVNFPPSAAQIVLLRLRSWAVFGLSLGLLCVSLGLVAVEYVRLSSRIDVKLITAVLYCSLGYCHQPVVFFRRVRPSLFQGFCLLLAAPVLLVLRFWLRFLSMCDLFQSLDLFLQVVVFVFVLLYLLSNVLDIFCQ